jgi:hypothetical protein
MPSESRTKPFGAAGDLAAGGLKLVHDHGVFAHSRDHGMSKRPNTSWSEIIFPEFAMGIK